MSGIPNHIMGDVWPHIAPGAADADYGSLSQSAPGPFPIRSYQTLVLTYTVGEYGLDDSGAIKLVHRFIQDGGPLQADDPSAANYVTAKASNGAGLALSRDPAVHQRPWTNGILVTVKGGYMSPGDTITLTLGDCTGGGPGLRLQTFCESAHDYVMLADPCACGVFLPVGTASFEIIGGPATSWVLTAPTLRRPGEAFHIGLRAEDAWGNATGDHAEDLHVTCSGPVDNLPKTIQFGKGARGHSLENLNIDAPGTYRFTLRAADGTQLATSNPLIIRDSAVAGYWGDLHAQSGETIGISTLDEHFTFARDIAHLDVTSHQGNDFQITNGFWQQINDLSAAYDAPGRFTVFPGYEWSGNTPLGGDHNVFFAKEGAQIHRSSHTLLEDRSDLETDAQTLETLFEKLQGVDTVLYAHVGGRPADISRAEDARLRTAVEVHSDWGTFEWILLDAFDLGYRVGVVCNSDGHKGAPGACYPGASEFGAYSGLTCFLAPQLNRTEIFAAMRRRHHYGTTGARMHIDLTAHLGASGVRYREDPRWSDRAPEPATTAIMGDIVSTDKNEVSLDIAIEAQAPIERVDIMRGRDLVKTIRPYADDDLGRRIRVIWEGAEYRGRGRQTHWLGQLSFDGAEVTQMNTINDWNLERQIALTDARHIDFDVITTGNYVAMDLWLAAETEEDAKLSINCPQVQAEVPLNSIGLGDTCLDAGGLERQMRIFRLPDALSSLRLETSLAVHLLGGENDVPIWLRVTTEDGHRAWTSPIYVIPKRI